MNAPRIENADRGITLNKSLAWTVLVAFLTVAFWIGATVQGLRSSTVDLTETQQELAADAKEDRTQLQAKDNEQDERIRALETTAARADERMVNVIDLFKRIDARLARIEQHGEDRP